MEYKIYDDPNEDAYRIRHQVFIEEQQFVDFPDQMDKVGYHLVGYMDGLAVATARLSKEDGKQYLIGKVAVLKEWRGKHLGAQLLFPLEEKVRELGGKTIHIVAQCSALGFYEKMGYRPEGAHYMVHNKEMVDIYKREL